MKMQHKEYTHPQKIRVHFLGETEMKFNEYLKLKKGLQFVGFLIFKMLSEKDAQFDSFSVKEIHTNTRTVVKLFRNKKLILALLEDYWGEWIVRLDGTIQDIVEFVMKYTINLVTNRENPTNVKKGGILDV